LLSLCSRNWAKGGGRYRNTQSRGPTTQAPIPRLEIRGEKRGFFLPCQTHMPLISVFNSITNLRSHSPAFSHSHSTHTHTLFLSLIPTLNSPTFEVPKDKYSLSNFSFPNPFPSSTSNLSTTAEMESLSSWSARFLPTQLRGPVPKGMKACFVQVGLAAVASSGLVAAEVGMEWNWLVWGR